jgi:hypothetical protein
MLFHYKEAEALLLSELGLTDFEPTKEAVSVKSLKESFLSSGRLDAEYYQKNMKILKLQLKNARNGIA